MCSCLGNLPTNTELQINGEKYIVVEKKPEEPSTLETTHRIFTIVAGVAGGIYALTLVYEKFFK